MSETFPHVRAQGAATTAALLLLLVIAAGLPGCTDGGSTSAAPAETENTLLVWAGDQAHAAPDFLAVVDFDPASPGYGKVLRTVPLAGPNAYGNEPHHANLSRDGKTLALGGLLSVLRGQDQVFFFDVGDPRDPQFIRSNNPPGASITDEFIPLANGGFLVTFMGGGNGAAPGRVVEYDAEQRFVRAWPDDPPAGGFNPHGIAVDEAHGLMLTSDFICPLRTLHVDGGSSAHLRGAIRVWDLERREITKTITVGDPGNPAGTMEVQLIPKDPRQRAYTAGMADNRLYLVDPQDGTATAVLDFDGFDIPEAHAMPQLFRLNRQGTRLFVSLNYGGHAGKVVMLDVTRPEQPKLLDVVDLGPGSGPHFLRLTSDERRLVVSDYFLVEDLTPGGVVMVEGDHRIHVIDVREDEMELDPRFDLDFDRDIATGPARPHGMVLLTARAGQKSE